MAENGEAGSETKLLDRPLVAVLGAVVAAFVAGVSVYAFFQGHVGESVETYLRTHANELPPGPPGPPGFSVPVGGILMWAGDLRPLPDGFEVCDGRPATTPGATFTGLKPDLVDRFPKGAPRARSTNQDLTTGGSHNLAAHHHSVGNLSIPNSGTHSHAPTTVDDDHGPSSGEVAGLAIGGADNTERGPAIAGGDHSHSIKGDAGQIKGIDGDGSDDSGSNQPAFAEVFFIIRVK